MALPASVFRNTPLDPVSTSATPEACGCTCDTSFFERELRALRPEQRARFAPSPAELLARSRGAAIERRMRLGVTYTGPIDRCLTHIARLVHL